MTNKPGTKKAVEKKLPSVAMQQRSEDGGRKYAKLTPSQLHQQTLSARQALFAKCVDAKTYTFDVLVPYCEEIIARYRMPGVGAKDRPNGKPTVEAYFRSITISYSTVRSWIRRKSKKLSVTEIFDPEMTAASKNKDGKVPHLSRLEARLLATASAANDLLLANKHGGNVEEAMKALERCGFTPQRVEEYIERPVKVATTEVEKMAVRLCKLIDKNDDKHGQKILALARELLTKVEPTTVQQVLAEENTWQQREARKRMPQSEKTVVPSGQPTNGVERRRA